MPQGFDFPRGSQMWLPLTIDQTTQSFPLRPTAPIAIVSILARRKPGSDRDPSRDGNESANVRHPRSISRGIRKHAFRNDLVIGATPLQEHLTGQVRPALVMLPAPLVWFC